MVPLFYRLADVQEKPELRCVTSSSARNSSWTFFTFLTAFGNKRSCFFTAQVKGTVNMEAAGAALSQNQQGML